jgi:hypothetical protein
MYQRDRDRSSAPGWVRSQTAPPRRSTSSVLALQRAIGNRATTRVLARDKNRPNFEHSVRIGKLGPIEVRESNAGEFSPKNVLDALIVKTVKGKHSDELKRMSESRTRVDTLKVESIVGENTLLTVTFSNPRIRGYTADAGAKTESWKAVGFDAVDVKRIALGKAR